MLSESACYLFQASCAAEQDQAHCSSLQSAAKSTSDRCEHVLYGLIVARLKYGGRLTRAHFTFPCPVPWSSSLKNEKKKHKIWKRRKRISTCSLPTDVITIADHSYQKRDEACIATRSTQRERRIRLGFFFFFLFCLCFLTFVFPISTPSVYRDPSRDVVPVMLASRRAYSLLPVNVFNDLFFLNLCDEFLLARSRRLRFPAGTSPAWR